MNTKIIKESVSISNYRHTHNKSDLLLRIVSNSLIGCMDVVIPKILLALSLLKIQGFKFMFSVTEKR